jgi:L-ascorbate metabolism protein UlaG (beta-lactamase superfamily)
MELHLVRHATMRFRYAVRSFITDPYLAALHTRPSYRGVSRNPTAALPCSPLEAIAGIEMALISHLHSDHFDPAAQELLPKDLPILCQPEDFDELESMGFHSVIPVTEAVDWHGITITRTPCQHGSGEVLEEMGQASGFVFSAAGEPTVYWVGDSIWYEGIADVISRIQPDVVITHSCGAVWGDRVPIVMDAEQTIALCRAAPNSTVVATHMEAVDHATVTREALRAYAEAHGIGARQLLIPLDGATLNFFSRS